MQLAFSEEKALGQGECLFPAGSAGVYHVLLWARFSPSIYEPDQARAIWARPADFPFSKKHSLNFRRIGGIGECRTWPDGGFRERDFEVRIWRKTGMAAFDFSRSGFLNLLAAPLWVFNFGMKMSWVPVLSTNFKSVPQRFAMERNESPLANTLERRPLENPITYPGGRIAFWPSMGET